MSNQCQCHSSCVCQVDKCILLSIFLDSKHIVNCSSHHTNLISPSLQLSLLSAQSTLKIQSPSSILLVWFGCELCWWFLISLILLSLTEHCLLNCNTSFWSLMNTIQNDKQNKRYRKKYKYMKMRIKSLILVSTINTIQTNGQWV